MSLPRISSTKAIVIHIQTTGKKSEKKLNTKDQVAEPSSATFVESSTTSELSVADTLTLADQCLENAVTLLEKLSKIQEIVEESFSKMQNQAEYKAGKWGMLIASLLAGGGTCLYVNFMPEESLALSYANPMFFGLVSLGASTGTMLGIAHLWARKHAVLGDLSEENAHLYADFLTALEALGAELWTVLQQDYTTYYSQPLAHAMLHLNEALNKLNPLVAGESEIQRSVNQQANKKIVLEIFKGLEKNLTQVKDSLFAKTQTPDTVRSPATLQIGDEPLVLVHRPS